MPRAPATVRRDLRAMCADGALFSVMVGAGETYLPAFALAVGAGEITAGLLAGLPLLGGAVVQLVTPFAVRAMGSHRRWVVACAVVQALTFVPLVAAAMSGAIPTALLFAFAVVYWASGMSTGPAWNTWADTLVPRRMAPRFFAKRARLAQVALLAGLVAAGFALEAARGRDRLLEGFALIFFAAGAARCLSAWMLASQSEPVRMPADFRIVGLRAFVERRAGADYRRLVALMLGLQASVHVAAPYFNPYMLHELAMPYDAYVALIAAALVAKALFSPFVAELAERLGSARVLHASALALAPVPALWMLSDDFGFLVGLQIFSGLAWGAYELITLLLFFETIPASERTSVLTLFNLLNAAAIVLGTTAGAWLLAHTGVSRDGYFALFAASSVARVVVVLALPRVRVARFKPTPLVTRTVAVGATSGSMDRPVLPSIDPRAAEIAVPADEPQVVEPAVLPATGSAPAKT